MCVSTSTVYSLHSMPVDFFHRARESTEYTVLKHKNKNKYTLQMLVFLLFKKFIVPAAKHRIQTASNHLAILVV